MLTLRMTGLAVPVTERMVLDVPHATPRYRDRSMSSTPKLPSRVMFPTESEADVSLDYATRSNGRPTPAR